MEDIAQWITQIEQEMNDYQVKRQEELDEFMRKSGALNFLNQTNVDLARYEGKLEILKSMLPEPEIVPGEAVDLPASEEPAVLEAAE